VLSDQKESEKKESSSDVEMTDEQNLQSLQSSEVNDETMKDDMEGQRLEDLVAIIPGKVTKATHIDEAPAEYKNQKLLEQKIAKLKQQHTMQQIAPDKAIMLGGDEQEDYMKFDIEQLIQMN